MEETEIFFYYFVEELTVYYKLMTM